MLYILEFFVKHFFSGMRRVFDLHHPPRVKWEYLHSINTKFYHFIERFPKDLFIMQCPIFLVVVTGQDINILSVSVRIYQ